jgi:hypothetical protein
MAPDDTYYFLQGLWTGQRRATELENLYIHVYILGQREKRYDLGPGPFDTAFKPQLQGARLGIPPVCHTKCSLQAEKPMSLSRTGLDRTLDHF